MSDVQIALLILGLSIVFLMIIFNWIQLKKIREKQKKAETMQRQRDPLFQNSIREEDQLDNYIVHESSSSNVSIEFLRKNLPSEINLKFESVVSLTLKEPKPARILIELGVADYLTQLRLGLYLRKDEDLWATGEALDDEFLFDQILLTLPLISRKLEVNEEVKDHFLGFIEKIREQLDVNQIWLANEDMVDRANELKDFKSLVNKTILIKVQPKTDSSFHFGAFQDFFNKANIRVFKDFHWYFDPKVDGEKMFKIMNLSRQPLRIESDAFIQGIIFSLDIPTTTNSQNAFSQMIEMINEFCIKLNAVMVDGRNKEIDSSYIPTIKKFVDQIAYEMKNKDLLPGSDQAIKYFG
ncbi:MAG: cell division protein ZipA C-terminal FtsZ-binding domain-containing protein [Methylophilaceae bacterium]|jgi:FtsZ-interacting cell division protein ZipA